MSRVILHSDMNNFYASVECMLNPSLKGKPIAVCGSQEERHGIVLAKNYPAKAYGVATGEVIWQAQQKCRDLVIVPPHYKEYIKYSKLAKEIYYRYTDLIEPFGMDECWLDITGTRKGSGFGYEVANEIKETIKFELGLTVSVGVSFNKIFAKLGSDMKKPDAVTCIGEDDFKERIWHLPASDLLGVGYASEKKLNYYGIRTIGALAQTDPIFLQKIMKSHGLTLWKFANGLDHSPVQEYGYKSPIKSVGHGQTTKKDLTNDSEVWRVILDLAQDIGHTLRENDLAASGVSINVRDCELHSKEWQMQMPMLTQSESYLAEQCYQLFVKQYDWHNNIRSITIRAINLHSSKEPVQTDLFNNRDRLDRMEAIDKVKDDIRRRFGTDSIFNAVLLLNKGMCDTHPTGITMPTGLLTCR